MNHKKELPSSLYKFYRINEDLKSTLKNNYIWLSRPIDFNDPFDCYKNLLTYNPDKNSIEVLFNKSDQSRQERRKNIIKYSKRPGLLRKQSEMYIEEEIKKFGVACFGEEYKNILMWSHYADCHKGLCLCFNPKIDIRTFLVGKVQYVDKFSPIDFFHNNKIDVIEKLFLTKSQEWKYEKEYRLFEEYFGKKYFSKKALQEVIFGCKTKDEDKREVSEIVKSNYPHVKFRQAIMKEREFGLTFQEIEV